MTRVNQKPVRRQHTVSRFYLRGFAAGGRTLIRVPLDDPARSHRISVDDATVMRDFYTLEDIDGGLDDFFEHAFGEIESEAAPALRRALEPAENGRWSLSKDDKAVLALWLALQYLRAESIRTAHTEMLALGIRLIVGVSGKESLRRHIEVAEATPVSDARLDAEWEDLTQPGGTRLRPAAHEHLQSVSSLLLPTSEVLFDRQWSLDVLTRKRIVTSDHPVVLLPDGDTPEWEGLGLYTAALAVPLNRHHVLVIGTSTGLPDMRVPGNAALANAVNAHVIWNARRAVYHHPEDTAVVAGAHLPPVRPYEVELATGGDLISEDGLFAGLSDQQLSVLRTSQSADRAGFTLADVAWPIPGRTFTWVGE